MATVLVVEDEPTIRKLLAAALRRVGIDVASAADGLEALEILDAATDPCRLILLDLMMPRLDGRAFLEALAKRPAARPIIILVTAAAGVQEIPAGIDLVIKKPFDLPVVTATVMKILQDLPTVAPLPSDALRPEPTDVC